MQNKNLEERLKQSAGGFARVVPFTESDNLLLMDFTAFNKELTDEVVNDTNAFIRHINQKLKEADAKYGIGGYGENRSIYRRSSVFDAASKRPPQTPPGEGLSNTQPLPVEESANEIESPQSGPSQRSKTPPRERQGEALPEPRRLHLGIDVWGKPYTKVMAPLNGIVHSFAFNNAYGDYGATIILTHNLEGETFHTLYGHLSLNSIKNLHEGQNVYKGDVMAEFGIPFENGQWPPHLHFQVIKDMQGAKGDYPGVCAASERETYLANCPDADLVLGMMRYAKQD